MEDIVAVPIGELRAASTAGGGSSLSTTAIRIAFPTRCDYMELLPWNFTTAVVLQMLFNPWLVIVKTTDNLVLQANALLDGASPGYSINQTDGTAFAMSALPTIANGGALYVGSHLPFGGYDITIGSANAVVSTATVKYWKSDGTWASLSATDNTASGGATLAQTGTVTWTMPTGTLWQKATLDSSINAAPNSTGDTTTLHGGPFQEPLFWTRFEVSAALTNPTTITKMLSINRSTAYAEKRPTGWFEERFMQGMGGICAIQAKVDAGSGSLIVNAGTTRDKSGLK